MSSLQTRTRLSFRHKGNIATMINERLVYTRIGMALISAQRVEFVTGQLLEHLKDFDKYLYGLTPAEFLDDRRHDRKHKTLGDIFTLLKLNPKLIIADELNNYKDARNTLAHNFWKKYLHTKSEQQAKLAVAFCNEFGKSSERMEKFFKGFIYFLALRQIQDVNALDLTIKKWNNEFE